MVFRARMLDQAETFIKSLQKDETIFWKTLLGASHNCGDVERAQRAAAELFKLDPHDAAAYVLMANTYAATGRWKEKEETYTQMMEKNIKKLPGITWVTVNGKT
jgi:DNA-binding SARP family transcriptional activator